MSFAEFNNREKVGDYRCQQVLGIKVTHDEPKMIATLTIDQLMALNNKQLIELAVEQNLLTPLELELLHRLEQFIAMYGDYLEEPMH